MSRSLIAAFLTAAIALGASVNFAVARTTGASGALLSAPAQVDTDSSFAIELKLPANVAAVDGRVLFDADGAEVVGVAPLGSGTGMAPIEIVDGAAVGAYGLKPDGRRNGLFIVVAPRAAGRISFRVALDSAADAAGNRVALKRTSGLVSITMGTGARRFGAPRNVTRRLPVRAPLGTRDLVADGRIHVTDVDVARASWEAAKSGDEACTALGQVNDSNGDGCTDIVDIQALVAAQGMPTVHGLAIDARLGPTGRLDPDLQATAATPRALASDTAQTWTVTSTADTADAANGDGKCADSQGRCTLRAAVTEANWIRGENRIAFDLPGTAPVVIQLTDRLSLQDRTGGVFIDGYSQPGSRVNTASVGSNAIPGVELRGTKNAPRSNAFRITSAGNTIRGFLFNASDRTISIDGVDAHDNYIVGNLMGFARNGTPDSYRGHQNVFLQGGAHHNHIGAPTLADRNVAGRQTKSIYLYGPGTDYNVLQNNFLCMTPSGMATAVCSTAIDHDFGPKHTEIGGTGPLERNVIGATTLNGIEISHGWNRNGPDTDDTWHNDHNHVVGNWIGFRGDGSYHQAFVSGQNSPNTNDANGVNVYDGSNYNVVEGNWIGTAWDGVNTMSSTSTGNVIRNNVIGESPLGQAAPLGRHGIHVRTHTKTGIIEGNTIRNAGVYGIGLTQSDVLYFRISRNIITNMSGTPIYLAPSAGDPTQGANDLTPAPVITSATTTRVNGSGIAGATVEVYRASRPAGQSGLPVAYLGSGVVAANGTWSIPVILQTGDRATALQIAAGNNTSMLGRNVSATFEDAPNAPVANFSWSQASSSLAVAFTDTSTNSPAAWSWDFGDGASSTERNPSHTYVSLGNYTVKLTASNSGGSNTATKAVTVSPAAQTQLAADTFGRSSSNGWGSADIGGQYALQGSNANYSVDGGAGLIVMQSPGLTRSALLPAVSERDVDIRFRVAADKVATGGRYFVYAVARRNSNNEYRPQLRFNTNGTLSVHAGVVLDGQETALGSAVAVPGLTQQAGAYIWVRVQITGASPTTIRIKAWADGQAEPQGWPYSATNSTASLQSSGSLGLRAYIASAASNAPVTFRFDDYAVTAAP